MSSRSSPQLPGRLYEPWHVFRPNVVMWDRALPKHVGAAVLLPKITTVSGLITYSHPFPPHTSQVGFLKHGTFSDQMLQC